VVVSLEAPAHPALLTRSYTEYSVAAIVLHTRMATNQRYPLIRVEFSHPQPADVSAHARIFECPVVFGADAIRMILTREVWDTARAGDNPDLFAVLNAHARMLMDQLPPPDDIVGRVREAIDAELRGGDPKLESIARHLAMSPRTLQRRLKDRGIVFNDLLDAMRYRVARTYLAQGDIAGTEVAYLLGFAEHSSFNRAFKRWAGVTPTEYRRRAASV